MLLDHRIPLKLAVVALIAAAGVLAAEASVMAQARPAAPVLAGTVTAFSPTATLTRGASTTQVTNGTAVDVGDRIVTGITGRVTITLNDHSTLELGESSNLTINQETAGVGGSGATTRVSLLSGIVRSLVNFSGARPNFAVQTPNAVAAARGTRYDTAYSEGVVRPGYGGCNRYTDVSVYSGVVVVTNPTNPAAPAMTVTPGYQVTVPCSGGATAPGPIGITGSGGGGVASPGSGGSPPPSCPVCVNMTH